MAKKPSITTITSGYTSTTALNANFEALREAFDNTVSRDGSTPNTMTGALDMNGNAILNTGQIDVESLTIGGSPVGNISSLLTYKSTWQQGLLYDAYDVVTFNGSSYLCLVAHTSTSLTSDLAAGRWAILAQAGAAGAGTGDMLAANNLSDVADASTSLNNIGGQPLNDILTDLAGLTQTAGTVPYFDTSTTASLLSFLDEDDMASDSATAVPSQQSVKAYVDTALAGVGGEGLGEGQTWQNVLSSRVNGVTYQNTTGKPIFVSVLGGSASGGSNIQAYVGVSSANVAVAQQSAYFGNPGVSFVVPDQHYYKASAGNGIAAWAELR